MRRPGAVAELNRGEGLRLIAPLKAQHRPRHGASLRQAVPRSASPRLAPERYTIASAPGKRAGRHQLPAERPRHRLRPVALVPSREQFRFYAFSIQKLPGGSGGLGRTDDPTSDRPRCSGLIRSSPGDAPTTSLARPSPAPPPPTCSSPRPTPAARRPVPAPWAGLRGRAGFAGRSSPPSPPAWSKG